MKINASSQDFPLVSLYGNKSPHHNKQEKSSKLQYPLNCFNNESPEFFRLDSMKENKIGYRNPFLDEVIKVDRCEAFKKMEQNRDQLKLIEKIKSRREFSQDPTVLKYIRSSDEREMQEKRDRVLFERNNKIAFNPGYEITQENGDKFSEKLATLNYAYSPKIGYKIKSKLSLDNLEEVKNMTLRYPETDKMALAKLRISFDPKKSSYLKNLSNFNIDEAEKVDTDNLCHFKKKDFTEYNCIKDKTETITPAEFKNKRWDNFYEK